jgi:drug/metabolite transporter (DMT)-like permease
MVPASDPIGRLIVVVGACLLGTIGVFSVTYYDHGGDSASLVFLRFAAAGAGFWLLAFARRAWRFPPRLIPAAVVLGGLQLGTAWGLIKGFDVAPVSLVVLIFYIYPLLATLLAVPLLRERLTLGRLLLLALGIGGVALAVGAPGSVPIAGVALGLLAAVCVSVNIVASRYLMLRESINALDLLPLVWLPPAILMTAIAVGKGVSFPTEAAGWLGASGVVVLGTFLGLIMFYTGVRRIGAANTSLLATLEPFVAVLLAFAFLDESLTAVQLVGGAMILATAVLLSLGERLRLPSRLGARTNKRRLG